MKHILSVYETCDCIPTLHKNCSIHWYKTTIEKKKFQDDCLHFWQLIITQTSQTTSVRNCDIS